VFCTDEDADTVDTGVTAGITADSVRILFTSMLMFMLPAGIERFTSGERAGAGRTVKYHTT